MDATSTVPQAEFFQIDLDPADVVAAYVSHRRRFAAAATTFDEAALATQSRCSEWTVADVLRHGRDVDEWMRTIWSGGVPFDSFDPRTTPNESVVQGRSFPDTEARDRYVASVETMVADVEGAGPERWGLPALSPAGFVPWWQSLVHAFFDSWIHERDVLLPLGQPFEAPDEETSVVLTYLLAVVPRAGQLINRFKPVDAIVCGIRVTAGEGPIAVTPVSGGAADVPVLTGDRLAVIDALSGRGSLEEALAGDRQALRALSVLADFFNPPA